MSATATTDIVTATTTTDPVVEALYDTAKGWIDENGAPSIANVIEFASMLVLHVQKLTMGPRRGEYKKAAVVTVIRRVAESDVHFDNDENRALFLRVVGTVVPPAIDTMVMLAKTSGFKKSWNNMLEKCCKC